MIRLLPMLRVILAVLLLLSAQVSAAETIENEEIMTRAPEFAIMLRGGGEAYEFGSNGIGYGSDYSYEYSDELQHSRRLWGISWSSLFCTFKMV